MKKKNFKRAGIKIFVHILCSHVNSNGFFYLKLLAQNEKKIEVRNWKSHSCVFNRFQLQYWKWWKYLQIRLPVIRYWTNKKYFSYPFHFFLISNFISLLSHYSRYDCNSELKVKSSHEAWKTFWLWTKQIHL